MLTLTEKLLFPAIVLLSLALSYRNFRLAFQIVRRGHPDLALDALPQRIWRALVVFLSQRTVLRARPVTSLMHAFIALGFTYCCGVGGAQMWKEEEPRQVGVNTPRFEEAEGAAADSLVVGCPFCMVMMTDASRAAGDSMPVRDVAEIVADSLA